MLDICRFLPLSAIAELSILFESSLIILLGTKIIFKCEDSMQNCTNVGTKREFFVQMIAHV
jgi:hypothetical protein